MSLVWGRSFNPQNHMQCATDIASTTTPDACDYIWPFLNPLIGTGFSSMYNNESTEKENIEGWKYKKIDQWSTYDTMFWLLSELYQLQVKDPAAFKLENFVNMSGKELKALTLEKFKKLLPEFGNELYVHLQLMILKYNDEIGNKPFLLENQPPPLTNRSTQDSYILTDFEKNKETTQKYDLEQWTNKCIDYWLPNDVVQWITHQLQRFQVKDPTAYKLESFAEIHGSDLRKMSLEKFKKIIPDYSDQLYSHLQLIISTTSLPQPYLPTVLNDFLSHMPSNANRYISSVSTSESSSVKAEKSLPKIKRKPGRPPSILKKNKTDTRLGRVWEFIRDLVIDPRYNPSVVSWVDQQEGVFRFENSDEAAKLWGYKRKFSHMKFDNFSRSIRHNYKKGYLLPVEKRRLVYKFGPNSTGWRLNDLSQKKSENNLSYNSSDDDN